MKNFYYHQESPLCDNISSDVMKCIIVQKKNPIFRLNVAKARLDLSANSTICHSMQYSMKLVVSYTFKVCHTYTFLHMLRRCRKRECVPNLSGYLFSNEFLRIDLAKSCILTFPNGFFVLKQSNSNSMRKF